MFSLMNQLILSVKAMKIQIKTSSWVKVASWVFFLLLFEACGGSSELKDTQTSGSVKVSVDDSYHLLIDAEVAVFENNYPKARIDTFYKCEADVINDFMNDSVSLIIVNRKLSDNQIKYLNERHFIPKTTLIAMDAIAFIVNNENPDNKFFYHTIKDIFLGKITKWNEINPKSNLGDLKIVFDNNKSGNPRYFKEKFGLDSLPAVCFAAKNNEGVISYVEQNKNAIGVIAVNWISDQADSVSQKFLQRFKVIGFALEGDNDPGTEFFKPYQYYIKEGSYPFTREVYCINRQTYSGLAYGFSSFVAGEKGQLIVKRAGLLPASMPEYIKLEIKH